jgi:uncharacterized protein involved in exopolysaccharide biosynthesis
MLVLAIIIGVSLLLTATATKRYVAGAHVAVRSSRAMGVYEWNTEKITGL